MRKISGKMNTQRTEKKTQWSRWLDKCQECFSNFEELLASLHTEISNQMTKYNPSWVINTNEYLVWKKNNAQVDPSQCLKRLGPYPGYTLYLSLFKNLYWRNDVVKFSQLQFFTHALLLRRVESEMRVVDCVWQRGLYEKISSLFNLRQSKVRLLLKTINTQFRYMDSIALFKLWTMGSLRIIWVDILWIVHGNAKKTNKKT